MDGPYILVVRTHERDASAVGRPARHFYGAVSPIWGHREFVADERRDAGAIFVHHKNATFRTADRVKECDPCAIRGPRRPETSAQHAFVGSVRIDNSNLRP